MSFDEACVKCSGAEGDPNGIQDDISLVRACSLPVDILTGNENNIKGRVLRRPKKRPSIFDGRKCCCCLPRHKSLYFLNLVKPEKSLLYKYVSAI